MKTSHMTIGKSILRHGATEKIKGEPVFAADLDLPSPLILKALRSEEDHAEILSVDTKAARRIDGVAGIFTAGDIPGNNRMGILNKDQPLLADDKVRSSADPVALVAADTQAAAEAALKAIRVTYAPHKAVLDPAEALQPGAPMIHDKGNLLFTRRIQKGEIDAAFDSCASVVEKTYRTGMIEHNYLEPDAGIGYVDPEGVLVIHASTQNPHYDHKELVSLLGVPEEKVRIIQATTGGGFGSKLDLNVQGFIGLALYHLKRPVRYVYSREEAYLATAKRHPLTIRMKTGADDRGRLLAMEADILCDTGAYGSYGIAVASRAAVHATGPYVIDNVKIECRCVYTNKPFCGAMRGFGAPQVALAHESQLDLHARELNIDPFTIREINVFTPGDSTGTGQALTSSVGIGECLAAVKPYYEAARASWPGAENDPYKRRGIGIGAMWYGIGNTGTQNPSTAKVEMSPDGTVTLYTGCADIGQGSTTILAQIVAETLKISPYTIRVVAADTRYTTNAGATSASRQTYISGNAVKDAADKLADVLLTQSVVKLETPKDALVFDGGNVVVADNPGKKISFAALAKKIHEKGLPLAWQGYFDPETVPLDADTGQGEPYATYAFACQMAQVEVDTLTGEVTVARVVAAHDVGKALHPQNVIGQIHGGVAMGVGFALMEEFKPGQTLSMKDYHIPTCADMPEVIPIIIESGEPSGPFGAKGVGEPALIPTAPAIINGLADALKVRIYSLPANLEKVLAASITGGHFGTGATVA